MSYQYNIKQKKIIQTTIKRIEWQWQGELLIRSWEWKSLIQVVQFSGCLQFHNFLQGQLFLRHISKQEALRNIVYSIIEN